MGIYSRTLLICKVFFMDYFVARLLEVLDVDECSELDQLKIKLGLQVLCHNLLMTTVILLISLCFGLLHNAVILLSTYGFLKLFAGGIHFAKSWQCLISTTGFILCGASLSRHITLAIPETVFIYAICILFLWIIGPQGTPNKPISSEDFRKLRIKSVLVVFFYLCLTLTGLSSNNSSLPLIAVIFETLSLIPNRLRSSS